MDNRRNTDPMADPDNVAPGLNPGALVLRLVGRCGTTLTGPDPLGRAPHHPDHTPTTPDLAMLAAHHADLAQLHLAECPCRGVELIVNDGDDGTVIHRQRRRRMADLAITWWETHPDYADSFIPDGFMVETE